MIKKIIKSTILIFSLSIIVCACDYKKKQDMNTQQQQNYENVEKSVQTEESVGTIGDKLPVARAMTAKMLSLIYNDKIDIETMDREIIFKDTSADKWYDKYINIVTIQGLMSGSGNNFNPEEYLTLQQAQYLIDRIDKNNKLKIKLTDETKDKPISYALWNELYIKVLKNISEGKTIEDNFGIKQESIIVLATKDNNSLIKDNYMITDKGLMKFEGLKMNNYIDREIEVLMKDNEIISILSLKNNTPVITNAYVLNSNNSGITIFCGGAERTYYYENVETTTENLNESTTENSVSNNIEIGSLVDIKIKGNTLLTVTPYSNKISDEIKSSTDKTIELYNSGVMQLCQDFKVYSVADGSIKWKNISDIIVGTDIAEYFIKDGKICGILINKIASPNNIRVGINTTGFKSLIHSNVILTATTDFEVNIGADIKQYKAGDILTISKEQNSDLFGKQRITIKPTNNGKTIIKSISRSWAEGKNPEYRGEIEVSKKDSGYTIVNKIDIEQYLYSVIPSEMPTSYGIEALKVQAITARSYAYNQYYVNRFHEYGANVDDSVNSQVYNNISEDENSIKAVDETKGKCITYDGKVVSANFFSTSAGITVNSGDVWANSITRQYPADTPEYLKSNIQDSEKDYGDLSVEENAYKFFKDNNVKSYDSNFPLFRWNVSMSKEEISASINSNIKERYSTSPKFIKTLQQDGTFKSKNIESIGELKDLEVVKRGKGGNIMEMKIIGTNATVLVSTEQNIRGLIKPKQYIKDKPSIALTKKDGSILNDMSSMPSTLYIFDKISDENGNLKSIKFYGGGYGHGVGMSQNGVKGMADNGLGVNEIIQHFYPKTEIKEMI